ncbi:MAG: crossover junction endodeoxyribonuclease RuvC [Candidatus Absconditabacteria bacterium]|nr:crossover junction endodeoxyribonuclease RuvC [Candidatus Absconditabacteria bacterium]MDD3867978.1 crossover junction endodeoxyribonuclease RuvC [Candidatus Absconditabacteria bacterium]MDD4714225.1 crossover junction endodeoxyribonuclease RuvC [Candidatus Absconditabacteria bacterium]
MILGIDPGVRKLGYALITDDLKIIDAGILLQEKKSPTRQDQFERVVQMYDFFEKLIIEYQITCVSMEKLFFTSYNQNNAEFVYAIRGALMMLFLKNNITVQEYTPIELKKYITGNGKADKMLVQKTIMRFFKLVDVPEFNDAADALGLAYLAKIRR